MDHRLYLKISEGESKGVGRTQGINGILRKMTVLRIVQKKGATKGNGKSAFLKSQCH